jgi:hypothetical protein
MLFADQTVAQHGSVRLVDLRHLHYDSRAHNHSHILCLPTRSPHLEYQRSSIEAFIVLWNPWRPGSWCSIVQIDFTAPPEGDPVSDPAVTHD